jgi:Asp-tRNA(Asn)/Glu-tRNA(Gln) amidotransferase A subunit family amidase
MPIGLQIIGDYFAESTLLRAAAAFEEAAGFDLVPPLVSSRG